MKKNIKGFTLVELLSIITILGIIVVLVVPQIGGSINSKKEKELEKIIDIVESAGKAYHSSHPDEYKIPLIMLVENGYLTNNLKNPITGEKLDGCVGVSKGNDGFFSYRYRTCEVVQVSLDVELNGGTSSQQFKDKYIEGSEITLIKPTKDENDFLGWEIVKGNGTISGNILKLGDTDTTIYAMWKTWPTLTVDLDEGSTTQNFDTLYQSGTKLILNNPVKKGYIFSSWTVTSGNGAVSGSNFTMGSVDTTIKAIWIPETLIYSYSCANTSGGTEPYKFTYTGNCTVIDEGNYNWVVKFTSSGTFTTTISTDIDVFLVGGGGGGGNIWNSSRAPDVTVASGGRGYSATYKKIEIGSGQKYSIVIGGGGQGAHECEGRSSGNGGSSSAFGCNARGGYGASAGGSGGSSTYEFGDSSRPKSSAGGGGGGSWCCDEWHSGGSGGRSGIVMIRNAR